MNDGNIASTEFKMRADVTLCDSLTGCDGLDDNVLVSRPARAVETDPRIILHKEDEGHEKAESLYKPHHYQNFTRSVEEAHKEHQLESPYDFFLKDVLHKAWAIPLKDLPELLPALLITCR